MSHIMVHGVMVGVHVRGRVHRWGQAGSLRMIWGKARPLFQELTHFTRPVAVLSKDPPVILLPSGPSLSDSVLSYSVTLRPHGLGRGKPHSWMAPNCRIVTYRPINWPGFFYTVLVTGFPMGIILRLII